MDLSVITCLVAAHILGDFLLQSDCGAAQEPRRTALFRHAAVHALAASILLGVWNALWVPVAVFAGHAAVDAVKAQKGAESLSSLLADQAAHLAILLLVALGIRAAHPAAEVFWVQLWGSAYLEGLVLAAGFVLTVHGGGVIIKQAVAPYVEQLEAARSPQSGSGSVSRGLKGGGRLIGQLERSLVFLFLLIGEPGGLGFLVAAKSIFRIAELKDPAERMEAEYIILGSLMSFAYGIAVSYGTMHFLSLL